MDLLGMMLGPDLVAAFKAAVLTTNYAALLTALPTLGSADMRALQQPAFETACGDGRTDIVAVLLESGSVDTSDDAMGSNELLHRAVQDRNVAMVRVLLEFTDVDVNAESLHYSLPLLMAVENGDVDCLRVLLGYHRIDVNATMEEAGGTWCALAVAADDGHVACLRLLLAADNVDVQGHGVNEDGQSTSALGLAAGSGRLECVTVLLAAGTVDVNYVPPAGDDPLLRSHPLAEAAKHDQLACLRALLAAGGINVNAVDPAEHTALFYAAQLSVACTEALLKVDGIDVNLAGGHNGNGITPLHGAAEHDMVLNVRRLLACTGIDPNPMRKLTGTTPLHIASYLGSLEVTRALLLGGGCRFHQTIVDHYVDHGTPGDGSPLGVTNSKDVRKLFHAGIDYWQRKLHVYHSSAMKEVVRTLLLIEQHLDAGTAAAVRMARDLLPHLPEELWLETLGYLRSADFGPSSEPKVFELAWAPGYE